MCNIYYECAIADQGLGGCFGFEYPRRNLAPVFLSISALITTSVGLYAAHNFATFSALLSKVSIAFLFMVPIAFFLAPYAHAAMTPGANSDFQLRTALILIWLLWITVTRGAFTIGFELGVPKRRILVLGGAEQAARIAKLVEAGHRHTFVPVAYVELPGERECCGFGGTFAVKNADTSMAMLSDKVRHVLDTRAEVCTSADTSCLMHIGGALRRQRTGVRTMHLAEILAAQE